MNSSISYGSKEAIKLNQKWLKTAWAVVSKFEEIFFLVASGAWFSFSTNFGFLVRAWLVS